MKQTFKINGMSCGSCRQTVEKALQGVDGVTSVQVNMSPPEAIIEKADSVTLDQLKTALSKAGNYGIGEDETSAPQKSKGGCCCG
ncbi:MAG TPA: heavy-metal-associated domain-containing protein [Lutibacter sp.]